MVRILIADDHAVVRSGLRRVLEAQPGWEVVAEAADGETLSARRGPLSPMSRCSTGVHVDGPDERRDLPH